MREIENILQKFCENGSVIVNFQEYQHLAEFLILHNTSFVTTVIDEDEIRVIRAR